MTKASARHPLSRGERLRENVGIPIITFRPYLVPFCLAGLALALKRRDIAALLVGAFIVIFTLSLLTIPNARISFWLPAAVPVIVLAVYALEELRRTFPLTSGAAGGGLFALGLVELLTVNLLLSQTNTLEQAYAFVIDKLPADSHIMIGDPFVYSVPLMRDEDSLRRLQESESELTPAYEYFLDHPEQAPQPRYDLFGDEVHVQITDDDQFWQFAAEEGIQYVIETDYCDDLQTYTSRFPYHFPYLSEGVRAQLELIFIASPFTTETCQQRIENRQHLYYLRLRGWQRVGPIVRIYKVVTPPREE